MITIGIPAYKGGSKLHLAIASALSNNTFIEQVIIADDGDNRDIVSAFQDQRIVYHRNPSRLGMWSNFLKCLTLSRSRYFTWLAEDDFISPSLGASISLALQRNPGAVAYMGIPTTHTSHRGSTPSRCLLLPSNEASAFNRIRDIFGSNSYGALFYSVFNTEVLHSLPFHLLCEYPSQQYSFDYVWMMHIAIHGPISYVPEQLYFYNQSNWDASLPTPPSPQDSDGLLSLNMGLTYLLGVLVSFFCFESCCPPVHETASARDARLRAWAQIISMVVSKYMLRSTGESVGSIISSQYWAGRRKTLSQFILEYARLIDVKSHSLDRPLECYVQSLLLRVSCAPCLRNILGLPLRTLFNLLWLVDPDFLLWERKASLAASQGVKAFKSFHLTFP